MLPRNIMHVRKLRLRELKVFAHSWTNTIYDMRDSNPGLLHSKAHAFSIKIGLYLRIQFSLFSAMATLWSMRLSVEFCIRDEVKSGLYPETVFLPRIEFRLIRIYKNNCSFMDEFFCVCMCVCPHTGKHMFLLL